MAQESKKKEVKKTGPVQETPDYIRKRVEILAEINADKVNIDRECFKKSTMEKLELKKRKKEYKESLRKK